MKKKKKKNSTFYKEWIVQFEEKQDFDSSSKIDIRFIYS